MELFISKTSPYVRKARILLIEGSIPCETLLISPWEKKNQISEFNPLNKIPILKLDSGDVLLDSKAICRYFDETYLESRFYGQNKKQRYRILNVALLVEGLIDAATALTMMDKVLETEVDTVVPQKWKDWQTSKILDTLRYLDSFPEFQEPLATWNSIADVALACVLGYLDFRLPKISWHENAHLSRRYASLSKIPSFIETVPTLE